MAGCERGEEGRKREREGEKKGGGEGHKNNANFKI